MTVHEEYTRRRAVLTEAEGNCIVQGKLGMAWRWRLQIMALDHLVSGLPVEEAGAEYDAEILAMSVIERHGAAVPVGSL
jgi:hypothetical protein